MESFNHTLGVFRRDRDRTVMVSEDVLRPIAEGLSNLFLLPLSLHVFHQERLVISGLGDAEVLWRRVAQGNHEERVHLVVSRSKTQPVFHVSRCISWFPHSCVRDGMTGLCSANRCVYVAEPRQKQCEHQQLWQRRH